MWSTATSSPRCVRWVTMPLRPSSSSSSSSFPCLPLPKTGLKPRAWMGSSTGCSSSTLKSPHRTYGWVGDFTFFPPSGLFLSLKAPAQQESKSYEQQRNQGEQMDKELTGPFCFIPKESGSFAHQAVQRSLTPLEGKTQGSFYIVNTHKTAQHINDEDYCK